METSSIKISKDLLAEIKKEKDETKVPLMYLLEKAWQEYVKNKGEKNGQCSNNT